MAEPSSREWMREWIGGSEQDAVYNGLLLTVCIAALFGIIMAPATPGNAHATKCTAKLEWLPNEVVAKIFALVPPKAPLWERRMAHHLCAGPQLPSIAYHSAALAAPPTTQTA